MLYKCVTVKMGNNGEIVEGKRKQAIPFPSQLQIGGLYFLRPGKLYRVVGIVGNN